MVRRTVGLLILIFVCEDLGCRQGFLPFGQISEHTVEWTLEGDCFEESWLHSQVCVCAFA